MDKNISEVQVSQPVRRRLMGAAGAGLAGLWLSSERSAHAQLAAEANSPSVMIERRGINRPLNIISPEMLEEEAKKTVYTDAEYVFVSHGSGKQWTLNENQRAWGDTVLQPHRMQGVQREKIDLTTMLLGQRASMPIIVTPFGSHGLHHPEAELATARGAHAAGTILSVSSASTASLEDIAKATPGPKFFQMYLNVDEGLSREVLQRVRPAGFKVVILTIDAIGQGSSDAYLASGKARPWLPYGNFPSGSANAFKTNLSWSDVEFIRKVTGLPVIVKGVTRPEDALAAVKAGAAAIQVSNHGGRALDGTPAAITVLPKIADAVNGAVPIIMDSGIRRGTDVAKALALGANAVAVGRPLMYALALGGAQGVESELNFLQRELADTMLHLQVHKPSELGRQHVAASATACIA